MLAENLPMMTRWVDYAAGIAASGRAENRAAERPQPLPHERYLWDTGFHWGEWAEPGVYGGFGPGGDQSIVATAYLSRSARIVSDAARVVGDDTAAARYAELAARCAEAWFVEHWDGSRLRIETQATYVRGLAFGLFPDDVVPVAVARLVELVHAADDHLSTGFLSTPMLLPVLADHGHADLAYRVLLSEGEPGWMVMLRRGATAIWESWDGIADDGTPKDSLDHYSKGAVITFLHEYSAGLRNLAPGWSRFRVRPVLGGGLTHAAVAHDASHGAVSSSWRIAGDRFALDVTVPEGSTAEIVLPDGTVHDVAAAGSHRFECALD
ncbi:alpha-L-rhamnosidase-related protein [Agromyces mangrovi Wang et al. 2018]|uniref:alpha-L-rhamnosidase-related protein n=1 Tax=Agromyces mangrovi TaxID=1858653 RepID=UPI002572E1C9|nr:alpha-L-rhamnosidase C-terminal domain-containing protein [Agromyces mangrovi]